MLKSIQDTGSWKGELWNRRKNGEIYPQYLTISSVKDSNGTVTNYVATSTDISQRIAAESEIHKLAFYDPLTSLPNRRLLIDRLKNAITTCARTKYQSALLFLVTSKQKTQTVWSRNAHTITYEYNIQNQTNVSLGHLQTHKTLK